jgi:hypothetical protein
MAQNVVPRTHVTSFGEAVKVDCHLPPGISDQLIPWFVDRATPWFVSK